MNDDINYSNKTEIAATALNKTLRRSNIESKNNIIHK